MPTLHKYVDKEGFYVKSTFASNGRFFHVVYQVSDKAASLFEQKSISDGQGIPKALFFELRRDGHLYTNKSGADGEPIDHNRYDFDEEGDDRISFKGLTFDANWWVIDMLRYHPQITLKKGEDDCQIEFEYPPEIADYIRQLVNVARVVDGTDFFSNLKKSYRVFLKIKD